MGIVGPTGGIRAVVVHVRERKAQNEKRKTKKMTKQMLCTSKYIKNSNPDYNDIYRPVCRTEHCKNSEYFVRRSISYYTSKYDIYEYFLTRKSFG